MKIDSLVHMANRIGEFFQSMPDGEEASKEIALHLRNFWEPRMRRALLVHLDHADGADLLPIVKNAMVTHRQLLG